MLGRRGLEFLGLFQQSDHILPLTGASGRNESASSESSTCLPAAALASSSRIASSKAGASGRVPRDKAKLRRATRRLWAALQISVQELSKERLGLLRRTGLLVEDGRRPHGSGVIRLGLDRGEVPSLRLVAAREVVTQSQRERFLPGQRRLGPLEESRRSVPVASPLLVGRRVARTRPTLPTCRRRSSRLPRTPFPPRSRPAGRQDASEPHPFLVVGRVRADGLAYLGQRPVHVQPD